jgi:PhoH-like ATPase
LFVLDTNVILHDASCIQKFEEHDLVIPITVLEELDNFKKGDDMLSYQAREFGRALDGLSKDTIFNGGVSLGEGLGKITVAMEKPMHPDLAQFTAGKADHHILNIAYILAKDNPHRQVVLVTKDCNLRMKAKAARLLAQDYKNDHVSNILTLTGKRVVEGFDCDTIQSIYKHANVPVPETNPSLDPFPNEYLVLRNGSSSAICCYDAKLKQIRRVEKVAAYGISSRNSEQTFAMDALLNPNIKLVTLSGKAGTGKTLMALACAIEQARNFWQILLARPTVALSNRSEGFLPGDINDKIAPYMQPLFDNLSVIRKQFDENSSKAQKINEMLESKKLEVLPLAYIRGRSLVKSFVIIDEAQNLSPMEVKTLVTRCGEGTKMVFTGDIFQLDNPYLNLYSNGLSYLISKFHKQNIYAHVTLEKGERSELAVIAANLL